MNDLARAKSLLREGGYTLVAVNGEETLASTERGVKPLLMLLGEGKNLVGFSAADRVVGKAAAFLYVLLGVKEVYADVLSTLAEGVLRGHGIAVSCQTRTERIVNRAGDGLCPMESAVADIDDAQEALSAIRAPMVRMQKK